MRRKNDICWAQRIIFVMILLIGGLALTVWLKPSIIHMHIDVTADPGDAVMPILGIGLGDGNAVYRRLSPEDAAISESEKVVMKTDPKDALGEIREFWAGSDGQVQLQFFIHRYALPGKYEVQVPLEDGTSLTISVNVTTNHPDYVSRRIASVIED